MSALADERTMRGRLTLARERLDADQPLPPDYDRLPGRARRLDELYRRHKPGLMRFIAGFGRGDDAEDIVHQVFARMAARDDARQIVSPAFYLRQVARNLLRDAGRVSLRNCEQDHISIEDVTISGADPTAALEARDRLARIERAVLRLKPLTREIFLACRVDGYSYGEIAERTGLSIRGVEKQMNRALKQLERHLSRDG